MADYPTLADWARVQDPDGTTAEIVEILKEENEVLEDMVYVESNLPNGHKTTIRTGLPEGTWRMLYQGVQPKKTTSAQVTDTIGNLENYGEVDKDLADLNGNTASWRLQEEKGFIQGMSRDMAEALFYADVSVDPEKFHGFVPRFNTTSAPSGEQILKASTSDSGNNDYTSVWLVVWSPTTVHGIFPKGSKAGLQVTDKGQVTVQKADGSLFEGYRTHYKWQTGLVVRDWRYVVRICNIKCTDLGTSAAPDLVNLMTLALDWVPSLNAGRAAFYCHRKVRAYLRTQITNKDNVMLSFENVAGKKVLFFGEVPVRICDGIAWDNGSHTGEDFVS